MIGMAVGSSPGSVTIGAPAAPAGVVAPSPALFEAPALFASHDFEFDDVLEKLRAISRNIRFNHIDEVTVHRADNVFDPCPCRLFFRADERHAPATSLQRFDATSDLETS